MLQKLQLEVKRNILNAKGFKTGRKLIAIESDDWGSIRIPSREAQEALVAKGVISLADPFSKYDALESEEDLTELYKVLLSYKDKNGNPPVITANCVVANPDFDKIRASGFSQYFYEDVKQTFASYPGHSRCFELWKEGMAQKVFFLQYHGREHINVDLWMESLRGGDKVFLDAFDYRTFAANPKASFSKGKNIMAALDFTTAEGKQNKREVLEDGYRLFTELLGFKSKSFIAPCYIWDSSLENDLRKMGVDYLQGSKFQNIPNTDSPNYGRKYHYTSQRNAAGQYYFVRNGLFEPVLNKNIDWVTECLKSISNAFLWGRPAIIGSHRLNFIGYIHPENRQRHLEMLGELLKKIVQRWPEVEFVNSSDLGDIISGIK